MLFKVLPRNTADSPVSIETVAMVAIVLTIVFVLLIREGEYAQGFKSHEHVDEYNTHISVRQFNTFCFNTWGIHKT